jgi:Family of unknown function (DUF6058)
MADQTFSAADVAYIQRNYLTLEALCEGRDQTPDEVRALIGRRLLPNPSYVLDDGTEMFPADYFCLPDEAGGPGHLREHFAERFRAAGGRRNDLEGDWQGYMSGTYGICLNEVVPETMVRKTALVDSLTELLAEPQPDDEHWRAKLYRQVEELDVLEREFSPDYDRSERFDQVPSRDRLISVARERYPDLFTIGERTVAPSNSRR